MKFILAALFSFCLQFAKAEANETPVISADGPTTFCEGESVRLTTTEADAYLWSPNGETTQSIVVYESGNYSLWTSDSTGTEGFSDTVSITVIEVTIPVITVSGSLSFCSGDSVTLISSEGVSYVWSPNEEYTQSISVFVSGYYKVIVNDTNGCRGASDSVLVSVFENPIPEISAEGPLTFCAGESLSLVSTTAAAYHWLPNGETLQSITVTTSGDYVVSVTDTNGCSGISSPVHVQVNPAMIVGISASGPVEFCEGDSVSLYVNATNAVAYQWYRNGVIFPGATGASITVNDFANYAVMATDQNGCSGMSPVEHIYVGQLPHAFAGQDKTICPGETITLSATGGEDFLWNNGETTQTIIVSPAEDAVYSVSVSNPYCGMVDDDTVMVYVAAKPIAAAQVSENPVGTGNPVAFNDVSGDISIDSWYWDFGDGSNADANTVQHTYYADGIYTIILTVENQYGCQSSDTLTVEIEQNIIIPNVITPNGDGTNDALEITNNGVDEYIFSVFNRWGQVVYETEASEIKWNGKTSAGVALEAGTYFYVLTVINNLAPGGKSFEKTGYITLLK